MKQIKVLSCLAVGAMLMVSLSGCGSGSGTGTAFVDQGTNRESFIAQKGEDGGAVDLPDAGPIGSGELNALLNEAQAQKNENIANGNRVSGSVNGFNPGALDTGGMDTTVPSAGNITLPEDWQHPTITEGGSGAALGEMEDAIKDAQDATSSSGSASSESAPESGTTKTDSGTIGPVEAPTFSDSSSSSSGK